MVDGGGGVEDAGIERRLLRSALSARSHGSSVTAIGSTMVGVADTCCTKLVQDPLTATGSANIPLSQDKGPFCDNF